MAKLLKNNQMGNYMMGAGGRGSSLNSSRSEFLATDVIGSDVTFNKPGCYVTLKKGIVFCIFIALAISAIAVACYYYGAVYSCNMDDADANEIEHLLNESAKIKPKVNTRLPKNVMPLHYRLKIRPKFDALDSTSTFSGHVTITIQVKEESKFVVLNAENLEIRENQVTVSTSASHNHLSLNRKLRKIRAIQPQTEPETKNNNSNSTPPPPPQVNTTSANSSLSTKPELSNNGTKLNAMVIGNRTTGDSPKINAPNFQIQNKENKITETLIDKPLNVGVKNSTNSTNASAMNNAAKVSGNAEMLNATSTNLAQKFPENETAVPKNVSRAVAVPPPAVLATTEINLTKPQTEESPVSVNETDDGSFSGNDRVSMKISPNILQPKMNVFHEQIVNHHYDPVTARYTINLLYSLKPGVNYTVDIAFTGSISEDFLGLYKTYYMNPSGTQSWMVSTNFPSIYARRAFPCFDEPSYKTPFDIIIGRRTNMTALSNMQLIRTESISKNPGWVWDFFKTTPPMSTFAVAFTVMDFESIAVTNSTIGTVLKIWAPKHELPNAKYALDVGYRVFKYYEEYFGVPYPLPKLDFVVTPRVPGTVSESWGLISFNSLEVLINETESKRRNKEIALETVCEALPHQWIGDLVTMPWWSDGWLKESFAELMTRVGINLIEPDWRTLERYPSENIRAVLWGDSLKTTRNVYTDLDDPIEFEDVMDSVVGGKGCTLLRTLKYTLSDPVFREGIKTYIEKWQYKNVGASELWDHFDNSAKKLNSTLPYGITVKEMMESWTLQPAYPVIQVTRNYTTGSVTVEQQIFTEKNDTDNSLWYIPLNYASRDEKVPKNETISPKAWMKKEKQIVLNNVTQPGNGSWLLFNVYQIGLYRVNYDATNWRLLQKMVEENPTEIYAINRAQIIDDAFEMAMLGYLNYTVPLELTKLLHLKERSPLTWSAVFSNFIDLRNLLGNTPYNGLLQKYFLSIIEPIYNELGTNELAQDNEDRKTLRNIVVKHACLFRYQPCLDWAELQFKSWSSNNANDNNDVIHKYPVQCMAIQIGGEKEWDIVWNKTKDSSTTDLETHYKSLGCARDAWLITRYLERTLEGLVPIHFVPTVWKSMTFESRAHGFKFLRENWSRIYKAFKNRPLVLKAIIDFLTQLSTDVDLSDLTTFYKANNVDLNNYSVIMLNVVDKIKLKIDWTNTRMQSVISWLEYNYGAE